MYVLLVGFAGKLLDVTFLFSLSNVRINSKGVDVLTEWQFNRPDSNSTGRMPYSLFKASPSLPPIESKQQTSEEQESCFY